MFAADSGLSGRLASALSHLDVRVVNLPKVWRSSDFRRRPTRIFTSHKALFTGGANSSETSSETHPAAMRSWQTANRAKSVNTAPLGPLPSIEN